MSTNTCGIRHKSSSTTIECSFAECQISSVSVGRTPWYRTTHCFCFTVHWHQIDLTFAGSLPSAGTCRATWTFSLSSCVWPLLFEVAPFPGLPIYSSLDHLLTFHGSEKEATTQSSVLYNTAEVVCLGCYLARAHHADGRLPLRQFRRRLKLIPKPKGTYNGTEKLRFILTLGWCLLYGNQLIRKCVVRFELCTLQQSDLIKIEAQMCYYCDSKHICPIVASEFGN